MTLFSTVVLISSGLLTVTNLAIMLSRPFRDWRKNEKLILEGQKCLLRNAMLETFYRHAGEQQMRQYERENFDLLYKAYKAEGGNSFIEDVYSSIREWDVVS